MIDTQATNTTKTIDPAQNAPHEKVDSLLECLLVLCRVHNVSTSKDALIAGLPLNSGRITPALLKRAATRVHLVTKILKKPLSQIPDEFMPVILLLNGEVARKTRG